MVQTVGNDPQGKGLDAGDGFISVGAVAHHPRQRRHFGQPPAIVLAFEFDRKGHPAKVAPGLLSNKRLQPASADEIMSRRG